MRSGNTKYNKGALFSTGNRFQPERYRECPFATVEDVSRKPESPETVRQVGSVTRPVHVKESVRDH